MVNKLLKDLFQGLHLRYLAIQVEDVGYLKYLSVFSFFFFKCNLLSNWLTYSVYSVLLVSGVDSCDSLLIYNTQCSS